jgi:membrane associated rhomboid family serine protease
MQLLVSSQGENIYPTVGASGGVFGLLLAFGMFFPREKLILIFPPIPMEARWFVIGFGAIELWFGITGTAEGIAHFAHLGGMLFGFILILYWKKHPPRF